jgi:hypothetical protein
MTGLNGVRDCAKLFEGGFEVINDFLGEHVGLLSSNAKI